MIRVIGHCDLDYFYAQVEEVENPSLKTKPVVVCVFSGRTEDSGVVSTANYLARELGVQSGMTIALAKKKLGHSGAVFIKMDHQKYETVSKQVMQIIAQESDSLEQTGIDEAFFDLTDSANGDFDKAAEIARSLKKQILIQTHLNCSIGLGRSKVVAKIGSDSAKPGGLCVVSADKTAEFMNPLAASKLYGVGPKTSKTLESLGIRTIGDLGRASPLELQSIFGRKFGAYLSIASRGEDEDPVRGDMKPTQFSRIITLKKDTRNLDEILPQLEQAIDFLGHKVKTTKTSFRTLSTIAILSNLSIHTKSKTFETPVAQEEKIRNATIALFRELIGEVDENLRRAGIRLSGLADEGTQISLSEFDRR